MARFAIALVALCSLASSAFAQGSYEEPLPERPPSGALDQHSYEKPSPMQAPLAVDVSGFLGGMVASRGKDGLLAGAQVLLSAYVLRVGIEGQAKTSLNYNHTEQSVLGGLGVWLGRRIEVFALGQLGTGQHTSWGKDLSFFGSDPGASANLPFAGVDSGIRIRVLRHRKWLLVRIGINVQHDLGRKDVSYSYYDGGLFGESDLVSETRTVGNDRFSLRVGVSLRWEPKL